MSILELLARRRTIIGTQLTFFIFYFLFLKTFLKDSFCLETKYVVIEASMVSSSNVNTRILKTRIEKCRLFFDVSF